MKPTTVHIRKTRHKDQPYTVEIKPPGKAEAYKLKQRYARPFTGKRGALRHLDARTMVFEIPGRRWNYTGGYRWVTPKGVPIEFK